MLIAVLFLQEAIKGLVSEFQSSEREHHESGESDYLWLYTNGLLAVIFSLGLLITALKSRRAKSWKYGFGTSPFTISYLKSL